MADISKIHIQGTLYDIKDSVARDDVEKLTNDLGDLAYKDNGSITVETIDNISLDNFTPEGTVNLNELLQTPTAASVSKTDFTPSGNVVGDVIKGGSIEVTLQDASEPIQATITSESVTPTGRVSKPTITVTPTADTIQPVTSVGTMASVDVTKFNGGVVASFTEGAFTPASLGQPTKDSFAVEGIVAYMGSGNEDEILVIEEANKSQAVTEQGSFSGGSKQADVFIAGSAASISEGFFTPGQVPTLGEAKNFVVSATASLDSTPVFTGDPINNGRVTKVEYTKQTIDNATFTPVAATLDFVGDTAPNVVVTDVTYNQATTNGATFVGNVIIPNLEVVSSDKNINVNFGVL